MRITEPGIYDMPEKDYHADPCPEPSYSNSIGKLLLQRSPAHARLQHPRLNPDWEPRESDGKMAFGSVAHVLMTGKGPDIVQVDAKNWQTKAAKAERDEALEAGHLPILVEQYEQALEMVRVGMLQLQEFDDCQNAFVRGTPEQVFCWKEGNTWLRCMMDWVEPRRDTGHIVVYDYKTTGTNAAPHAIARHLYDMDYHMQHAMYERALHALIKDAAGMVVFRFVVQETDPPYALSVIETDPAGKVIGQKKTAAALSLWRSCMAKNKWPAYPKKIIQAELPAYLESSWLEREERMHEAGILGADPYMQASDWMDKTPPELISE